MFSFRNLGAILDTLPPEERPYGFEVCLSFVIGSFDPEFVTIRNAYLLPYEEFSRGRKIACGECIEIDTACDRLALCVLAIPIRRTAPSVIHPRTLMP